MDSVKWLGRIVAARDPLPPERGTYQESRQTASGEVERQPLPRIQVKSVIVDPRERTVLRRGKVEIRGLAWTGSGKIESVEVSPDTGNTWRAATLGLGSDFEWVIWKAFAELTQPGAVEFVVRARDAQGQVQPAERDPTRLDGYSNNWYHRVRCVVV
jgi:sulfane dehydrogenase subunit SoxC